jgi:hypothetical protein
MAAVRTPEEIRAAVRQAGLRGFLACLGTLGAAP